MEALLIFSNFAFLFASILIGYLVVGALRQNNEIREIKEIYKELSPYGQRQLIKVVNLSGLPERKVLDIALEEAEVKLRKHDESLEKYRNNNYHKVDSIE